MEIIKNAQPQTDEWSRWLLQDRYAGDPSHERELRLSVDAIADRVLDGARLSDGMSLLDLGTGDGLVAFRAIDRVGASLGVILADISAPLLCHAASIASQRGITQQCQFIEAPADYLPQLSENSVDVVTARAVIAYVSDKASAFGEIERVLKPGGRCSIAEPVLRDDAFEAMSLKKMVDEKKVHMHDDFFMLLGRWKGAQFPNTEALIAQNPLTNYGERDLVRLAMDAGLVNVHMELHLDLRRSSLTSWDSLLKFSPHPWAPSLGTVMDTEFSPTERRFFESVYRPRVESGQLVHVDRTAYLTAQKTG